MSVRRSQIPAALVQPANSATATSTNPGRQYNRRARRLLARYRKDVPPHVREYLLKSYARGVAVRQGLQFAPGDYLDGFLSALEKFTPLILAGALPGYGPLRACFGIDLVLAVAPAIESLEQQRSASRDARRSHSAAVSLTDTQRLDARVALECVLGGDPDATQRLDATSPRSRTARARVESAENLAREAVRAREEVPAELLEDAGLSAETLTTFEDTTRKADEAAGDRSEKESAAQTARAQLAEPCGRILRELRVLLQAARHARKKDPTTPRFSTRLVKHKKSTAAEGEDTTPEPATPAPAQPVTKPA